MSRLHLLKGRAVDWENYRLTRNDSGPLSYHVRAIGRICMWRLKRALAWPGQFVRGLLIRRDMRVMRKQMADYREECRRKREAQLEAEAS